MDGTTNPGSDAPPAGLRPTVRFGIALALTVLYVAFAVVVSESWRGDLADALGPVPAWIIPILLAYLPGFFVGFMVFSLIFSRYRPPSLDPPAGPWPEGSWPPVTVVIAALDEEATIAAPSGISRSPTTRGSWSYCWRTTARPTAPRRSPTGYAEFFTRRARRW